MSLKGYILIKFRIHFFNKERAKRQVLRFVLIDSEFILKFKFAYLYLIQINEKYIVYIELFFVIDIRFKLLYL